MKYLILAALAVVFSSAAAMAESVRQVVGGTCTADAGFIYVFYNTDSQTAADSIKVEGGQFSATLEMEKNTYVCLMLGDRSVSFFADGVPVKVDFNDITSRGSEMNTLLGMTNNKLYGINRELEAIYKEYIPHYKEENSTDADIRKVDELEPRILELSAMADSIEMEVFKANRTNLLGAAYLTDLMYRLDYAELKEILSADNELTRHPLCEPARQFIASLAKRAPGSQLTDITENDMNGDAHRLSEWVGKGGYVMLDFWASWCGPCRAEMPNVAANYAKYHSRGFEVIGISFDSKPDQWKRAVERISMPWIQLSDLRGWKNIAASTYNITHVPASILVDPDGKIVDVDLKGDMLSRKLKEIFGE